MSKLIKQVAENIAVVVSVSFVAYSIASFTVLSFDVAELHPVARFFIVMVGLVSPLYYWGIKWRLQK